MKNVLTYATLLLLIVLQSTILNGIEVLHIMPNIILVFVVCYSMYAEPVKAVIVSVVAGLAADILQSHHVGLTALMLMFISLALSVICSDYIRSNLITVVISVIASTLVFECIYGILVYILFDKMTFGYMLKVVLLETVYNVVVSFALLWWAKYLAEDEIRSF